MLAVWFSDKEDKDQIRRDYVTAQAAFARLTKILTKKLKKSAPIDYKNASWSYYQADSNGYNRALTEVMKLIKETD